MYRHFRVVEILTESELVRFNELATQPDATVDDLAAWVKGRGHAVSRSSVGRYLRHFRGADLDGVREAMGCLSDSALRRKIGKRAGQLSGGVLIALGVAAEFLAMAAKAPRGNGRRRSGVSAAARACAVQAGPRVSG